TIVGQQILPAAMEYRKSLAESAAALKAVGVEASPEIDTLNQLTPLTKDLQAAFAALQAATRELLEEEGDDANAHAQAAHDHVAPAIARARDAADALETAVADKFWPLPKYTELLLTI
ncbi:hypothetical protein IWQ56_000519, partial [Coemansia nantahalensis]